MSELAIVYRYFTLAQWKDIAASIKDATHLSPEEKFELLAKLPSAAL